MSSPSSSPSNNTLLPYSNLNFPVSLPRRKFSSFSVPRLSIHDPSHRRNGSFGGVVGRFDLLFQRSRATNLLTLLLALIAGFSLLINVRMYFHEVFRPHSVISPPISILSTLQSPYSSLTNLIIVPGNAIWLGGDIENIEEDPEWLLQPMQKGGNVKTFIKHIKKAVELTLADPLALLIYSGGQTRVHSEMTEATSYARLAKAANLYDPAVSSGASSADEREELEFERVTTENYALDSFENILFSIARFKEYTGKYPVFITVVGFGMKRKRYETVHRESLRWSSANFDYISIDNEGNVEADYAGEKMFGLEPYLKDTYGCHSELISKRKSRNPYRRYHPYHTSAPELINLFEYCPKNNERFSGTLPWN